MLSQYLLVSCSTSQKPSSHSMYKKIKHIMANMAWQHVILNAYNRNTPMMIRSSEFLMLTLCHSIKTQWTKVFVSF